MRGILSSLVLLALAGCASAPGIKTVIVEKPVVKIEKCIKKEDVPTRPAPLEKPAPTNLETALAVALEKIAEYTHYGNQTETVLQGCLG